MDIKIFNYLCIYLYLLIGLGLTPWVIFAIINPGLQPQDLFDRYKTVAVLEVEKLDDQTHSLHLHVRAILKGELPSTRIILRAIQESAQKAYNDLVEEKMIITAFVGSTRRGGSSQFLFYLTDGHWGTGEVESNGDCVLWKWLENHGINNPQSMEGTFNGDPVRFAEMMEDAAQGCAYFPAQPFVRFNREIKVGALSSMVLGIGLYDLDLNELLDIIAVSNDGCRVWMQMEPLQFVEKAEAMGLKGAKGPSISIADVNGDGWPDLLIGGQIWLSDGDCYHLSNLLTIDMEKPVKCSSFVEVNGDGYPDVILSLVGNGLRIYLHPGQPEKGYMILNAFPDVPECRQGNGFFFVGDWNGDKKTDIFYSVGEGLLLLQRSDGSFQKDPHRILVDFSTKGEVVGRTGAGCMTSLWGADSTDLVFAHEGGVNFFINQNGKPVDAKPFANEIADGNVGLVGLLTEDLNADGYIDIYGLNCEGDHNFFYMNRGYGSFMVPYKYQTDIFPEGIHNEGSWSVASGDIDGDGANDLVLGGLDGAVSIILNDSLHDRGKIEHPTYHQRILDQTVLVNIIVRGKKGVVGSEVLIKKENGKVVAKRILGSHMVTGSCGPNQTSIAIRQPGDYHLVLRYGDGLVVQQPLPLQQPRKLTRILIEHEKKQGGNLT